MAETQTKPRVAVHKFSSCDGCQLALLNLGEALLDLTERVELIHFAEAGLLGAEEQVDIAFIEGSVTTPGEAKRILNIRQQSKVLITIGACATSGGIQALRNQADGAAWMAEIYPSPQFIDTLATSTAIAEHVRVDFEIWGCPINGQQIIDVVKAALFGVAPLAQHDKLCLDCKRQGRVCVMVTQGEPCMGPVTNTGCGSLCPSVGRGCFACYGPAENANATGLVNRFQGLGLVKQEIAQRLLFINNNAEPFASVGQALKDSCDD